MPVPSNRSPVRRPAWIRALVAAWCLIAISSTVQGQVCEKSIEDCLEPHGFPGCSNVQCCETICLLDSFCCSEWDSSCVDLANLSCTGLCGAFVSGSCFTANGTPACNNRVCCETICLADPFCCETVWDASCSLTAGFICEVEGGDCGDPGTGSCDEPNGSPACEDRDCCEAVCVVDPTCCEGVWDVLCVSLAGQVCGGLCVVDVDPSDTVEIEGCDGESNDPCGGGEPETISPDTVIAGSFGSPDDVDVLQLDLEPLDLDGDGLVRVRLVFNASAASLEFLSSKCGAPTQLEMSSLGCLATTDNQCLPATDWWIRISPTGAVGDCEDVAWRLQIESADTCGTICGRSESCLMPHDHPGCEDEDCCIQVCEMDPNCCNWSWDSLCASQAANLCGGDPPANDLCSDAIEVGFGNHDFRQLLATTTGPESECVAEGDRGGDVWFRHRSACDGLLRVGTCSIADFDTVVDVFRGDCEDLVPVVCIDDDFFCTFDTASMLFLAECGVDYLIRVSGVDGADGNGALEVECTIPACELCEADLNGDGVVGGADFGILLSSWGACKDDCAADLDGDGTVSGPDIGLLLVAWGDC